MKITFFGQLGPPRLMERGTASPESRVAALAELLAVQGHSVTVTGTSPYLAQSGTAHGVNLARLPSLDPTRPGGWLYLILASFQTLALRPNVVHVHGFRAAFVSLPLKLVLPQTTFIWTIDHLAKHPRLLIKLITRLLALLFARITSPSRSLQYRLLNDIGVRAVYIPDGYTPHEQAPTLDRALKLAPHEYAVALVSSARTARVIAAAFRAVRDGQRLVVVTNNGSAGYTRLTRQFRFIKLTPGVRSAQRRALITQAQAVIVADDGESLADVLTAMHAARPIIAVPQALYQETLGVTGQFVRLNDRRGLATVLAATLRHDENVMKAARAGRKRALRHFTWKRILTDYETAYRAGTAHLVALDSLHPVRFIEPHMSKA